MERLLSAKVMGRNLGEIMIQLSLRSRRIVRKFAGVWAHCPIDIDVIDMNKAPRLTGESYYWTWSCNPGGTRVWSNKGRNMWSTYYWPSTLSVEVGIQWILDNCCR